MIRVLALALLVLTSLSAQVLAGSYPVSSYKDRDYAPSDVSRVPSENNGYIPAPYMAAPPIRQRKPGASRYTSKKQPGHAPTHGRIPLPSRNRIGYPGQRRSYGGYSGGYRGPAYRKRRDRIYYRRR